MVIIPTGVSNLNSMSARKILVFMMGKWRVGRTQRGREKREEKVLDGPI
jgi:hypothetical protein